MERSVNSPQHPIEQPQSQVTFLTLWGGLQLIVTAGLDGWVRCWDMRVMMDAEADADSSLDVYLEPAHELRLTSSCGVSCAHAMLLGSSAGGAKNLICDLHGALIQISTKYLEPTIPPSCILDDAEILFERVTTHSSASYLVLEIFADIVHITGFMPGQ